MAKHRLGVILETAPPRPTAEPIGVISFAQWHQWKRGEFDPWSKPDEPIQAVEVEARDAARQPRSD